MTRPGMRPDVSVPWSWSNGWMAGWGLGRGIWGKANGLDATFAELAKFRKEGVWLEDGEERREQRDRDAGDGFKAEETVLYLRGELGVGGFVCIGGVEGDVRMESGAEGGAGCFGVRREGGGADEAGSDDVLLGVWGVAVAEQSEQVGVGHECQAGAG